MKEQPAVSPAYNLFSRLKQVSPELISLDRKPLIAHEFRFPFEKFAHMLSEQFSTEVSITVDTSLWTTFEELEKEKRTLSLDLMGCSLFGISTPFTLLFPQNILPRILSSLLQDNIQIEEQPKEFFQAFQAFFLASVVAKAKESSGWKNISIQLIDQKELAQAQGFFTYRCTIKIGSYVFPLIVALPPAFLDGLQALPRTREFGKNDWLSFLPIIPISIEAARTHAPLSLLQKLQAGDILFVDFPFFMPNSERARVILTYRGIPLFRAKVKNGVIKLLEMSNNQQAFQPLVAIPTALSTRDKTMSTNKPEVRPKQAPKELSEEELPEEREESLSGTPQEQAVEISPPSQPLSFDDLPLIVVVQLKELSMTLEQLRSLQAGNLLDLDIHPEQTAVQLVVQGHTIAEGDLIAIGDKLGVRITAVGNQS